MRGKLAKDIKAKWYPAIAIAIGILLIGGGGWLVASRWMTNPLTPTAEVERSPEASPSAQASPTPLETAPANPIAKSATRQGALRVGNPTDYPVRVALLAKKAAAETSDPTNRYDIPAHWDFAPQEGGMRGLVVSLPDRSIKVRPGDILVAFAQDGSRRYWGPYVIGETDGPTWNVKLGEWELILQP